MWNSILSEVIRYMHCGETSPVNSQLSVFLVKIDQNQVFATSISLSNFNQITSFKMLFHTVLQVLFSYVYSFGPKKYLSTPDLRKQHNNPNIFTISKYGNFLQHESRSGIHLICVHNLPDVIWFGFEWKQGYWTLFVSPSI